MDRKLARTMSDARYTRRECRNEPHGKRRAKRELARALRRHGKAIVRRAEQFG